MTTVADVMRTFSDDAIKAKLLGYLQAAKAPTTDWNSGAFLRSLAIAWQQELIDYVGVPNPLPGLRQRILEGAVPALASTSTSATSAWLALVADQTFDVQRNFDDTGAQFAATYTVQTMTLTCDVSHGPYSVTPGSHIVRSPKTGNRYISFGTATVPSNGFATVAFRAEFQQDSANGFNYSDGPGTLTDLSATPMIGVTASNVAPSFSDVSVSPNPPAGTGVVTVGGSPPAAVTAYDALITVDGQSGAALFQYRANGGVWSSNTATGAAVTIPSGPTITFTNDVGGANPSFIEGDRYSFTSPGTPITTHGIDPETDADLLLRCLERWPDPDVIPDEKHKVWAMEASPLITRVRVSVDATRPGFYDVTIAGAANPLAGAVRTLAQTYIDKREGIGAQSDVEVATVVSIVGAGTVYAPAAQLAAAQAQAAANWDDYVVGTDVGGVVRVAKLDQFLRDAGVVNAVGLLINGGTHVNLTSTQVAQPSDITTDLTWKAI